MIDKIHIFFTENHYPATFKSYFDKLCMLIFCPVSIPFEGQYLFIYDVS